MDALNCDIRLELGKTLSFNYSILKSWAGYHSYHSNLEESQSYLLLAIGECQDPLAFYKKEVGETIVLLSCCTTLKDLILCHCNPITLHHYDSLFVVILFYKHCHYQSATYVVCQYLN